MSYYKTRQLKIPFLSAKKKAKVISVALSSRLSHMKFGIKINI